jgi:hypothetical protein
MTEIAHLSDLEIQGLLDDALRGEGAAAARAHLATCRDCTRRVRAQSALFAAIESWEETPPSRDLAPEVVRRLSQRRIPFGLSVATAVQAALALLIAVLAWPLVAGLFSTVPLPAVPAVDLGALEVLALQLGELVASSQTALQPVIDSADVWLNLAPQWIALRIPEGMALAPAIVAGALLVAVLGNSILLAGDGTGRTIRPRRS